MALKENIRPSGLVFDYAVLTRESLAARSGWSSCWKLTFDPILCSAAGFPAGWSRISSIRAILERQQVLVRPGSINSRGSASSRAGVQNQSGIHVVFVLEQSVGPLTLLRFSHTPTRVRVRECGSPGVQVKQQRSEVISRDLSRSCVEQN